MVSPPFEPPLDWRRRYIGRFWRHQRLTRRLRGRLAGAMRRWLAASSAAVLHLLGRDRHEFVARLPDWRDAAAVPAATTAARVLIVCATWPEPGSPGAARLRAVIDALGGDGGVDLSLYGDPRSTPRGSDALAGIPLIVGRSALLRRLIARGGEYRAVVCSGWDLTYEVLPLIRALSPRARIVADVVDWQPSAADPTSAKRAESAAAAVDGLLALSDDEQGRLRDADTRSAVLQPRDLLVPRSPSPVLPATVAELVEPLEREAGPPVLRTAPDRGRVLVLGVYLLDRANTAPALVEAFASARNWDVEQRWAAIGAAPPPDSLRAVTAVSVAGPVSKFTLINRLCEGLDLGAYAYVVVTDDDIDLPREFLDRYLALTSRYGFALAQPARTHDSYTDHQFVAEVSGIDARLTTFVEIGPLFSVAREAYRVLMPFDEAAPMGWGLDSVWPVQLHAAGLRLGIVDATPVRHALRRPLSFYSYPRTRRGRQAFLQAREHLPLQEAFLALETYPPDERP